MSTLDFLNKKFDDAKMNCDFDEMLDILKQNETFLKENGWEVQTIFDNIKKIQSLLNSL